MLLTIFIITLGTVTVGGGLAVAVGFMGAASEHEVADAAATLRAIAHRGGVTEPIPFASSRDRVNAPGLVEVLPHSQRASAPAATSPAALPRPASVENPLHQAAATDSEAVETPVELPIGFAEEPDEDEAAIVVQRWEDGESMTKTILNVWGIRAGGGIKYRAARQRYKQYLKELSA